MKNISSLFENLNIITYGLILTIIPAIVIMSLVAIQID